MPVKGLFVFFMILITVMSMMFPISYFRQKEPNHICFLLQGMCYRSTCHLQIIKLVSGEIHLMDGRLLNDRALTIDWMDMLPAPFAVLELMSCCCTQKCEVNSCSCGKYQLPCTDASYCSDDYGNQSEEKGEISPSDLDDAE